MMGEQTFEDALKRLEEVVELLEDGRLPLEEALELYSEGVLMARHCHGILESARQRIEMLTADGPAADTPEEGGDRPDDGLSQGPGGKDQTDR